MIQSKIQQLALSSTVDILKGLKQFALEQCAASYSDSELLNILAQYGGSMVKAISHLQTVANQQSAKVA